MNKEAESPAKKTEPDAKLGDLIGRLFFLRAVKSEKEEELKEIRGDIGGVENDLIKHLESYGIDRAECEAGSVTMKPEMYPNVESWDAFWAWLLDDVESRRGFLNRAVNAKAVRDMFMETGLLPIGIEVFTKPKLNYRKRS